MRQGWVIFHRWAGLVLVLFLTMAGLTGALLAWPDALERWSAPTLFVAPAAPPGAPALDPLTLRERVAAQRPDAEVFSVKLDAKPGETVSFFLSPKPGGEPLADNQVFVDPVSGRIVGARRWGDIAQGAKNLVPFLLRLHYQLAMGAVGYYAFGIAALIWTLDCFVGAYLTLPPRPRAASGRLAPAVWWSRWKPAWKVRWRAGQHKLTFDLHRAGGLWIWALLFVFAWSAVSLNLREVYAPVTRLLLGYTEPYEALPTRLKPTPPALSWRQAYTAGRAAMAVEAQRRGFSVQHEVRLGYDADKHVYLYRVRGSRDVSLLGETNLYIDADNGRAVAFDQPSTGKPGDRVTAWIMSLHTADVFGWPYRVLVSIVGVMVAMLSVTGVLIWSKKRRAARLKRDGSGGLRQSR